MWRGLSGYAHVHRRSGNAIVASIVYVLSMYCYSVLKCSRRSSLAGVPISGRVSPLAHHLAHVIRLAREFGHPPDSLALEVEEAMGSAARH